MANTGYTAVDGKRASAFEQISLCLWKLVCGILSWISGLFSYFYVVSFSLLLLPPSFLIHFLLQLFLNVLCAMNKFDLPTVSLTAESCPFFFVHTYFPLLALRATLFPRHSMSNIVLTSLGGRKCVRFELESHQLGTTVIFSSKDIYSHFWGSGLDLSMRH